MNVKKAEHAFREVWGIVCAVGALLLIFSLASYDPFDIPVNTAEANDKIYNAVGWLGANVSFYLFLIFGLAAWVLPFLLISACVVLFIRHEVNWQWKLCWAVAFLIAAAGLLDLQTIIGEGWRYRSNVASVGGFIGENLNGFILVKLLGRSGTTIVLLALYVASLIFIFEIKPLQLSREFYLWAYEQWHLYHERKLEKVGGKLAAAESRLIREQRELTKKLARQTAVVQGNERRAEPMFPPIAPPVPPEPEPLPAKLAPPVAPPPPVKPEPKPVKIIEVPPVVAPLDDSNYILPTLSLLDSVKPESRVVVNDKELQYNLDLLVYTLRTFGIEVDAVGYTPGATITRYEVMPKVGVRVDKIVSLQRDLARALKAERINILAPIPGKDTVGVEIPNTSKVPVVLRELFETPEWDSAKAKIPLALGKDVYGQTLVADLADMPHLLIAGTTGSGKSVCINCILLSLLYRFRPTELRLILVDPKQVEMQIYNTIPHLVVPVVVEAKKVLMALRWVINEMEKRYKILAQEGVRNITAFNNRTRKAAPAPVVIERDPQDNGEEAEDEEEETPELFHGLQREKVEVPDRLPYIVVIIDELADLMQTAPADVEAAIARLTAKARAAGIHLIVATQTPRREVVTGVIKTNIPCRIAFQVPSSLDSRVILDESGAENLLGKGDMLYLPPGSGKFTRGQGAFVTDQEVLSVVEFCSKQSGARFESEIHQKLNRGGGDQNEEVCEEDQDLIRKCMECIRQEKKASTSMLQRRLRIGYNRAAWVIDFLERKGVLAPSDNSAKPRDILVEMDQLDPETLF